MLPHQVQQLCLARHGPEPPAFQRLPAQQVDHVKGAPERPRRWGLAAPLIDGMHEALYWPRRAGNQCRRGAIKSTRSWRMCITQEMRWPGVRTTKTTSLVRESLVAPHTARRTMVSRPNRSRSTAGATATPWRARGVTGVLTARTLH